MNKIKLTSAVLTILCCLPSLLAQQIGEVVFEQEPGRFQFAEDVLKNQIQTRKGDIYSERVVNDDVKRLYAKGFFSDIETNVTLMPDGKRRVVFKVSPKAVVERIVFEGNEKYSAEELGKKSSIALHNPLRDDDLKKTLDDLRDFYQSVGLKDSSVNFSILNLEDEPGCVEIVFKIHEGLRVRINHVKIENNTVYPEDEIRSAIATRYSFWSAKWLSWIPLLPQSGLLEQETVELDKMRIRELYLRKGYLDFQVQEVRFEYPEGDPELVDVIFVVEEGEPYFIGNVQVTGAKQFEPEELKELTSLKPGYVYNVLKEQDSMEAIESAYAPFGYDDLLVTVKKNPNYETHTVDLEYELSEGRPYTINRVIISGNRFTKYHVIMREMLLEEGDPVDREKIEISRRRLLGLGYFGRDKSNPDAGVEITTAASEDPDKKDVYIQVEERDFFSGGIGATVSDVDGVAGQIEIAHTNLDILDPSNYFSGGGQRAHLSALVGIKDMDAKLEFTEPWLFGIPLRFDFKTYYHMTFYNDWRESYLGFTTSLTKNFFDDYTSAAAGYTFEWVNVSKMDSDLSRVFQDEEKGELIGRVFLNLERNTLDDIFDPRNGYDISLYGALNTRFLGGTVDYYKLEQSGMFAYTFFHDWFTIMGAAKVGHVGSFKSGEKAPIFDRYFLGGGDTIRGFPYRSIGPADYNDDVYGGQTMWLVKAELSHPIYSIVRGAFFADIGNTTSGRFGPLGTPNMGIGYGLRIKVPGIQVPLRLDLAYPILVGQPGLKRRLRVHFSAGFSI